MGYRMIAEVVEKEDSSAETTVKWAWAMGMCYCKNLNEKVDMRIEPASVKPNIKEICKNVKQCHSFQ